MNGGYTSLSQCQGANYSSLKRCTEKLDRPELYHIELCEVFGMVDFDRIVPQNVLLSVLQQEPQLHTFTDIGYL